MSSSCRTSRPPEAGADTGAQLKDEGLSLRDFDFELPPELIAQEPAEPRDSSRLLVLDRATGRRWHRRFRDLAEYLVAGDCLVLNTTRVRRARLVGARQGSGGVVEVLLLRPLPGREERWEALVRPGRRLRPGARVVFGGTLTATIAAVGPGGTREVVFDHDREAGDFGTVLERLGKVPLPPYIHREIADAERYQTVYSDEPGSAAAPTAGLHFTPEMLARLAALGVRRADLVLHIGIGTFRPMTAERIADHVMHAESYRVPAEAAAAIEDARAAGHRCVAVGTTVVRTLETVAAADGHVRPGSGSTELFIRPGFRFRAVDALVTNFHLPRSSLLVLVSAFAGRELILDTYREAIREGYRFFSFGDAMLIL